MRHFTDVIRDIRRGKARRAASEKLAEVVRAVLDIANKTGRPAIFGSIA